MKALTPRALWMSVNRLQKEALAAISKRDFARSRALLEQLQSVLLQCRNQTASVDSRRLADKFLDTTAESLRLLGSI